MPLQRLSSLHSASVLHVHPGIGVPTHWPALRSVLARAYPMLEADRYEEARRRLAEWAREGRIKHREDILDGIEQMPRAFLRLLRSENFGKQLVRVGHQRHMALDDREPGGPVRLLERLVVELGRPRQQLRRDLLGWHGCIVASRQRIQNEKRRLISSPGT